MKRVVTVALAATVFLLAASMAPAFAGGKLLVSNYADKGITVIDADLLEVAGEIPTGSMPVEMVASSDGTRAYAAIYGTGDVLAIDPATFKVVGKVKIGEAAFAMDITPDGRYLVVGDFTEKGDISLVDTSTMKVVKKQKALQTANCIRVSPDGSTVFVTNGEGEKTQVFKVDGLEPLREIETPQEVYAVVYSKDGSRIYFKSVNEQVIAIYDAATLDQVGRMPVYDIDGLAFTNDGKEMWYGGPEGYVTVYSLVDNKQVAKLETGSKQVFQEILFSADGKRAFVSPGRENNRSVLVFDTATKELVKEIKLNKWARNMLYLK